MKHLSKEQMMYLHSMAVKKTGGLDGNKRIGMLAMMVFLEINGIELECSDGDIVDIGLGIASGKYEDDYIIEWIISCSNK